MLRLEFSGSAAAIEPAVSSKASAGRREMVRVTALLLRGSSVEFLQLLSRECRRERKVIPLAHDVFLSLPAQHIAQKLADSGIDLRAVAGEGVRLEIDEGAAGERIGAIRDVLAREGDKGTAGLLRESDGFHTRRAIRVAGVSDAVAVARERVQHELAVVEFLERLVPRVRAAHDARLEVRHAAGMEPWRTIDIDRLVGPFAGEAELPPGADVLVGAARHGLDPLHLLPAAGALVAVNAVELLERELRERI